jgi:hypothetical protein
MAPPPSYTLNPATLPTAMWYRSITTSEDLNVGGLVLNSFYRRQTGTPPAGITRLPIPSWITAANITNMASTSSVLGHYATNFTALKSELLPIPQEAITAYGSFAGNMPQNPGY